MCRADIWRLQPSPNPHFTKLCQAQASTTAVGHPMEKNVLSQMLSQSYRSSSHTEEKCKHKWSINRSSILQLILQLECLSIVRVHQGIVQESQAKLKKTAYIHTGKYNPFPILTGTFLLFTSFSSLFLPIQVTVQQQTRANVSSICVLTENLLESMPLPKYLFIKKKKSKTGLCIQITAVFSWNEH